MGRDGAATGLLCAFMLLIQVGSREPQWLVMGPLYSWPAGTTCHRSKGVGMAGKGKESCSSPPSGLNLPLYGRGGWGAQHLLKALAASFIPLGHHPPAYPPIIRSISAPSQIPSFLHPDLAYTCIFSPGAACGHVPMESSTGFPREQQDSAGR